METDPLVTMLVGGLVTAFAFGYLALMLKMPLILAYILGGIVAGPYLLGATADPELVRELADFGLVLMMFGLALRFPPPQQGLFRWSVIPAVAIQVGLTIALAYGISPILGIDTRGGLILGAALSLSSAYLLLTAMIRPGANFTAFKALTSSWLGLQSALALIVMIVLTTFATDLREGTTFWALLGEKTIVLATFVIALVIFSRRILAGILVTIARLRSREIFTLGAFAIALCIAYAAYVLFEAGLAISVFLAGLALNQAELTRRVGEDLIPFRDAFAVPFFVTLGMMVDPQIFLQQWAGVLSLTAIILVANGGGAFLGATLIRVPFNSRLKLAASLAMSGEFSVMIAGAAFRLDLISEGLFVLVVTGTAVTVSLNPFMRVLVARLVQRYA